MIYVNL